MREINKVLYIISHFQDFSSRNQIYNNKKFMTKMFQLSKEDRHWYYNVSCWWCYFFPQHTFFRGSPPPRENPLRSVWASFLHRHLYIYRQLKSKSVSSKLKRWGPLKVRLRTWRTHPKFENQKFKVWFQRPTFSESRQKLKGPWWT